MVYLVEISSVKFSLSFRTAIDSNKNDVTGSGSFVLYLYAISSNANPLPDAFTSTLRVDGGS